MVAINEHLLNILDIAHKANPNVVEYELFALSRDAASASKDLREYCLLISELKSRRTSEQARKARGEEE